MAPRSPQPQPQWPHSQSPQRRRCPLKLLLTCRRRRQTRLLPSHREVLRLTSKPSASSHRAKETHHPRTQAQALLLERRRMTQCLLTVTHPERKRMKPGGLGVLVSFFSEGYRYRQSSVPSYCCLTKCTPLIFLTLSNKGQPQPKPTNVAGGSNAAGSRSVHVC